MRLSAQTVVVLCGGNSNLHETLGCTGVIKSPFPAGRSQVGWYAYLMPRRHVEGTKGSRPGAFASLCPAVSSLRIFLSSVSIPWLLTLTRALSRTLGTRQPVRLSPWINATFTVLDVASPTTTVIPRVTGRLWSKATFFNRQKRLSLSFFFSSSSFLFLSLCLFISRLPACIFFNAVIHIIPAKRANKDFHVRENRIEKSRGFIF